MIHADLLRICEFPLTSFMNTFLCGHICDKRRQEELYKSSKHPLQTTWAANECIQRCEMVEQQSWSGSWQGSDSKGMK